MMWAFTFWTIIIAKLTYCIKDGSIQHFGNLWLWEESNDYFTRTKSEWEHTCNCCIWVWQATALLAILMQVAPLRILMQVQVVFKQHWGLWRPFWEHFWSGKRWMMNIDKWTFWNRGGRKPLPEGQPDLSSIQMITLPIAHKHCSKSFGYM